MDSLGSQQGINVLVQQNAIVLRHATPLVLERPSEVRERMGFQHWQGDEGVRLDQQARHLDFADRFAWNFNSGHFRKVDALDSKFPGQACVPGDLE